jgi:type I restriction enzyme S subunit
MSKKRLVPKRRFKGFTDDWEQRKLGEVAEITMGQSPDGSTYSGVPSGNILIQGNADLQDGWVIPRVWTTQVTKKAEAGDLIMSVRAPAGTIGKTAYDAVIGRGVAAIKGNEFMYQMLLKMDNDGYWKAFSSGSTFESLNSDNIRNAEIIIPKEKEQQLVGSVLNNLDHLITLHQRKLEKAKSLKKSLLSEMFPAEGERKPKRRFPGFTGDWEQRKLGEVADIVGGGTPSTNISEYWDGNIDWYSPAEIADQIYVNSSLRKITERGFASCSAKLLPIGTVLFTSRAGIGKTAILSKGGCTNQGFQSIVPHTDKLDSYFIYSRTEELKRYGETFGAGSTFVEVSGKQMSDMPLMLPKMIEEQKMIGTYFEYLDHLITLHQRKLEKLQNLKKAYLNEMFI